MNSLCRTKLICVALMIMAARDCCRADTNSEASHKISPETAPPPAALTVRIHNGLVSAPAGIAFVVNDQKSFVLDVGRAPGTTNQFVGLQWRGTGARPSTAAPDDSIHQLTLESKDPRGANIQWDWGRVGDAAAGRLRVDRPTTLTLKLVQQMWPDFSGVTTTTADGATGESTLRDGRRVIWRLMTDPAPISHDADSLVVAAAPASPVYLVAGIGNLPPLGQVDSILKRAEKVYHERRPSSLGDWGDFVGAIADNLNNSRIYSSDNHLLAHTVGRNWSEGPNYAPYFCWDSFFNGALACLDDPKTARDTVRGVLSCATEGGFVPNYGHWQYQSNSASTDRSQPPVGALCVWKMHQRWPDTAFLQEVYPKLVKWHAWWMKARDGNQDGLLEWGSNGNGFQGALYETGWDDTLHFQGAEMVGPNMNANAVDLNALYSMDAEYLARIAESIGLKENAEKFRHEHQTVNQRINDRLWNEDLGTYCSRLWGRDGQPGKFLTRLTPMNFYPLICGAPDSQRAQRVLKILTDPKKFWGRWSLPTLAYDDPDWKRQHYWRGKIWAPVNYLVFQGLKRYATPQQRNDFARSSVELFMRNWTAKGVCGENYLSTDGSQSSDPNYTWGALLCLIGVEAIVDQNSDGSIATSTDWGGDLNLRNIPIGGKLYRAQVHGGKTIVRPEP